jgi:hypothetical protein
VVWRQKRYTSTDLYVGIFETERYPYRARQKSPMTITHIFTPATAGATKINHEQRAGSVKAHLVSPLNNEYEYETTTPTATTAQTLM